MRFGMTGDAPLDDPRPPVLAGGTPLIFDWRPVRWRKTRLMVALALALAGHLLVFYLFQVATESSPRQAPPVRAAMALMGTDERRLLERLADRLPGLSPPSPLEYEEANALAALVKGYVPTWQDHRPALKPLPGQGGAGPLPPLMAGASGVLPPLPAGDAASILVSPKSRGPVARAMPVLAFQSGLTGRPLVSPPAWPPVMEGADWPEEGPASFMLSVEPSGKVSSCLSLGTASGLDEAEVDTLRAVLLKLRFQSQTDPTGAAWGWVDVLW